MKNVCKCESDAPTKVSEDVTRRTSTNNSGIDVPSRPGTCRYKRFIGPSLVHDGLAHIHFVPPYFQNSSVAENQGYAHLS